MMAVESSCKLEHMARKTTARTTELEYTDSMNLQ